MRIDKVYIEHFKNLRDFSIDFDERYRETILLGRNASGKSNFMEALILIFRNIDLDKQPEFNFDLSYEMRDRKIRVVGWNGKHQFHIDGVTTSKKYFQSNKAELFPKYVFTYYSGISNRLEEHFDEHQKRFYDEIIKPESVDIDTEDLRRLFYVRLIHSYFVLMAFYSFEDKEAELFLKEQLGITGLDSILFILRKPSWANAAKTRITGDERFWHADGIVKGFLQRLYDLSLAPIRHEERIKINFRKTETQERLYLYVQNENNLRELASFYEDNLNFFKVLESTYISDLIEGVRIRVKKENVDGSVTFKELSEGEQQLLTVLGLLKFTSGEDSLIILDEPDTHLNPYWKWKYLDFLDEVVKRPKSAQIIINTHDPIVIGRLMKEQVRMFRINQENGQVRTVMPDVDPKGLGVSGILTSDLFDLPTTLDSETQQQLNRKRWLQIRLGSLSETEQNEFEALRKELDALGFYDRTDDELYNRFLQGVMQYDVANKVDLTEQDKNELDRISRQVIEEILNEKNIKS